MPDLVKKLTVGAIVFLVVFVVLLTLKDRKSTQPTEQYSTPPVPANLLTIDAKERQLRELVEREPQNRDLLFQLGALYFESNRFQQAIDIYNRILRINERDVDTLNDLGLALHYTGKSKEGADVLRKATSYDPKHQRAWLSLGFVLAASGRTEEAKGPLNKAISLNPENDVGKEAKRILGLITQRSG